MHRVVIVAGILAVWLTGSTSAQAQDCNPLKPSRAIDTEIRNVTEANANILLRSLGQGSIKNDYQRIEQNQKFSNPDEANRWSSFIYMLCTLLKSSSLSDNDKLAQYFKLVELSRQSPPPSPTAPPRLPPSDETRSQRSYDKEATLKYWQSYFFEENDPERVLGSLNEMMVALRQGEISLQNPRVNMEFSRRAEAAYNGVDEIVDRQQHLSTKNIDRDLVRLATRNTELLKQLSYELKRGSAAFRTAARFLMNGQYPPEHIDNEIKRLGNRMLEISERVMKLSEELSLVRVRLREEYGE